MKEDWIFGNVNRGSPFFRDPKNSAIAPYIGNFHTNLFRCPGDPDVIKRQMDYLRAPNAGNPYLYSYAAVSVFSSDGSNRGMTSIYRAGERPLHFKASMIKNASQKFLLVEDNGDPMAGPAIDDGRWTPSPTLGDGNILSARHRLKGGKRYALRDYMYKGLASVSFADGHVEGVAPYKGHMPDHFDPMR
jgi:prepilin-type processing-associated H-X9-DG protein